MRIFHAPTWVLAAMPIAAKKLGLIDWHWFWVLAPLLALFFVSLGVIVLWIREKA